MVIKDDLDVKVVCHGEVSTGGISGRVLFAASEIDIERMLLVLVGELAEFSPMTTQPGSVEEVVNLKRQEQRKTFIHRKHASWNF